jgi:hypothetical protein
MAACSRFMKHKLHRGKLLYLFDFVRFGICWVHVQVRDLVSNSNFQDSRQQIADLYACFRRICIGHRKQINKRLKISHRKFDSCRS